MFTRANMGLEIERKFLVKSNFLQECTPVSSDLIQQGYLLTDPQKTLRVRIRGNSASVAIKSRSSSIVRHEFEYAIPLADAQQMIQLFSIPTIEKIRHIVPYGGKTWEIDVYLSQNKGLIVGEIELVSENEQFDTPPWILNEISSDKRYSNSSLMLHPFSTW